MGYTVCMHSIVKRLRERGVRRTDREIHADPGVLGRLTLVHCGMSYQLKLHGAGDDAVMAATIPILYNAEAVTWHGEKMLWQGEERELSDDPRSRTWKQEWSVKLAVQPPAEVPQPTHRLG